MKIYVGNLSHDATEEDLKQTFSEFGQVDSVVIIRDRETGSPRGFGFVEMASGEACRAAMAGLNGKEMKGRKLHVNEAITRTDAPAGKGGFAGAGFRPKGGGGAGGRKFGNGPHPAGQGDRRSGQDRRAGQAPRQ